MPAPADAVRASQRLTVLASAALLVLLAVALASLVDLGAQLALHAAVGVLLVGPLVVKLGSTGYRFVRFYAGDPAFVRHGPPPAALRLLAPLLVAATLVLVGSGFGLLIAGPSEPGLWQPLHGFSFVIWLVLIALHVVAHGHRLLALLAADWWPAVGPPVRGRGRRVVLVLGSLIPAGLWAAAAGSTAAAQSWPAEGRLPAPAPVILGVLVAVLAVLVARPRGWDQDRNP